MSCFLDLTLKKNGLFISYSPSFFKLFVHFFLLFFELFVFLSRLIHKHILLNFSNPDMMTLIKLNFLSIFFMNY